MSDVRTIIGAACWASAIINSDYSGLNESEAALCDAWLKAELEPGEDIVDVGEPYFSWSFGLYTKADVRGGDLAEYTVLNRGVK